MILMDHIVPMGPIYLLHNDHLLPVPVLCKNDSDWLIHDTEPVYSQSNYFIEAITLFCIKYCLLPVHVS